MNSWTNQIVSVAITQAVQIGIVIVLIAIVTGTVCRHRPRLAYALWLLALVKCITPPLLSSPTSVFSWINAQVPAQSQMMVVHSDVSALTQRNVPIDMKQGHSPSSDENAFAQGSTFSWQTTAVVMWLAGVLVYTAWIIARHTKFRRALSISTPASAPLKPDSGADVRVTSSNIGPAVVGVIKPIIVIPRELVGSPDFRAVLTHELIHLGRRDHWAALLQTIVQAIWWWHPLVWWLNRQLDQARELSCDEEAIAGLQCDAADYVQMLMNVIRLQRQQRLPAIGVGMRSFDITKRRINHLLGAGTFNTPRRWATWLIFTAGLLVLLPGAGLALSDRAPTTQVTTSHNGSVRFDGFVTDFNTKQPIVGARVMLVSGGFFDAESGTHPATGPNFEGTTGADGKVSIDIPLEGTRQGSYVEVRVYHPKYAARSGQVAGLWLDGKPRDIVKRDNLTLVAGEEITGVVEDPDGNPLPNTKVSVRSVGGDAETRFLKNVPELSMDSSVTDEHGRFRFNVVKDANFVTVWAEPTKFAGAFQDFGNRRGDIGAIRVTRGVHVVGLLVDDVGKPVSGVAVVVESARKGTKTSPTAYRRDAITDAQGHFTIAPLAPGDYRIAPIDNRFVPQVVTLADNMAARAITFRAAELATVRGRLIRAKDAPRNRQPFEVFGGEGDTWFNGHSTTDVDGNFEFRVPKGLTNLQFDPSSHNDGYVYQWKRGENGKLRGGQITLAALDGDVTDLVMLEQRSPSLTIKATGPDGNPVNTNIGAEIRYADPDLWQPWGSRWSDKTQRGDVPIEYADNRQRAVIKYLVPDRQFTVTVWVSGFEPASQTLKLAEGESRELEIKLTPQGTK